MKIKNIIVKKVVPKIMMKIFAAIIIKIVSMKTMIKIAF